MNSRLSLDEVREWARIYQTGSPDEVSRTLNEAYLKSKPFIVYIALRAAKPGVSRDDVIAAANEGFVKSLMSFDWESESSRLGFIGSYVRNYVLKECASHISPMSSSYSSYSRDNRIKALKNALEIEGKTPTPEMIAEASTNPKFSRAGYGRKRKDGSDRQPAPITPAQVREWEVRSERVYSDIDGADSYAATDSVAYSELVELARELAKEHCEYPSLVMENFEEGKIPAKDLRELGVSRADIQKDIEKLVKLLREQLTDDDLS